MTGAEQIRIVKGNPTEEEVAAVVIALATLTARPQGPAASDRTAADRAAADRAASSHRTGWSAYWRTLRTTPLPRPWRTSLR